MDAVEYLKEKVRMCNEHRCRNCPLGKAGDEQYYSSCRECEEEHPEEAVEVVKKWSAEHPKKTRQTEFLKMFPNATIVDGMLEINPCHVDYKFNPQKGCGDSSCIDCRKEYWNEEVE